MSETPFSQDEFRELLDTLSIRSLTAIEMRHLSDLIRHDRDARWEYLLAVDLEAGLEWYLAGPRGGLQMSSAGEPGVDRQDAADVAAEVNSSASSDAAGAPSAVPDAAMPAVGERQTAPASASAAATVPFIPGFPGTLWGTATQLVTRSWPLSILAVMSATLSFWAVMAIYIWPYWRQQAELAAPMAEPKVVVAELIRAFDCRWEASDPEEQALQHAAGAQFEIGQSLALESGLAEVAMSGGSRLVLEGPCRLGLESSGRVFLNRGSLAAAVPPWAAGFRVQTERAMIVDLGTEFGVQVDQLGSTEVQVFRGAVEMVAVATGDAVPNEGLQSRERLVAGQAARVVVGGPPTVERVTDVSRSIVRELPRSIPLHARVSSQYSAAVIGQTHPVIYWNFDEAARNGTRDLTQGSETDIWSPSQTGLAGPAAVEGYGAMSPGNRAVAVGSTGAIGTKHLAGKLHVPTGEYSVQWWFNSSVPFATQGLHYLMGRGNGTRVNVDLRDSVLVVGSTLFLGGKTGHLAFFDGDVDHTKFFSGETALDPDKWYQVTLVRSGTSVNVYLDGLPEISALAPWIDGDGEYLTVGHRVDLQPNLGQIGRIDEVAVWSRALSPAEILATYQAAGRPMPDHPENSK